MKAQSEQHYVGLTVFMRRLQPDLMGFYTSLAGQEFMLNFDRKISAVNMIDLLRHQIRKAFNLAETTEIRVVIKDVTYWQDELGYSVHDGLDRLIANLKAKQTL